MHPGFFGWWKHRHHGHHDHHAGCGPHEGRGGPPWGDGPPPWAFGHGGGEGGFGVRRPLRFLAHHLELSEAQTGDLAAILDTLKIERAQAAVDERRTTASLAESIESGSFDAAKASAAAAERGKSTERVQAAVVKALEKIHALLTDEQRKRLSYLLRTGQLSI
jgi:Spy/CpxP family protein refolding chaperone